MYINLALSNKNN